MMCSSYLRSSSAEALLRSREAKANEEQLVLSAKEAGEDKQLVFLIWGYSSPNDDGQFYALP